MANLLATEQVHFGDLICIDRDQDEMGFSFVREGENVVMPVRRAEPLIAKSRIDGPWRMPGRSSRTAHAIGTRAAIRAVNRQEKFSPSLESPDRQLSGLFVLGFHRLNENLRKEKSALSDSERSLLFVV